MNVFSKKPVIRVISVKHEVRRVTENETTTYGGYGGGGTTKSKTVEECNYTIVLLSRDGELMTREFNGKWDLTDIKCWEDL